MWGFEENNDGLCNHVLRFVQRDLSPSPANAARDCADTDTTTTAACSAAPLPPATAAAPDPGAGPLPSFARNSAVLCTSSSTVSAEVTQPEHARQSCNVTCTHDPGVGCARMSGQIYEKSFGASSLWNKNNGEVSFDRALPPPPPPPLLPLLPRLPSGQKTTSRRHPFVNAYSVQT